MGQTDFPTAAHASVNYFIAIAAVVLPLLLLGYLRERRWRLRETAIRALLECPAMLFVE